MRFAGYKGATAPKSSFMKAYELDSERQKALAAQRRADIVNLMKLGGEGYDLYSEKTGKDPIGDYIRKTFGDEEALATEGGKEVAAEAAAADASAVGGASPMTPEAGVAPIVEAQPEFVRGPDGPPVTSAGEPASMVPGQAPVVGASPPPAIPPEATAEALRTMDTSSIDAAGAMDAASAADAAAAADAAGVATDAADAAGASAGTMTGDVLGYAGAADAAMRGDYGEMAKQIALKKALAAAFGPYAPLAGAALAFV